MKVKSLAELSEVTPVVLANPERDILGVYVGDLLSWVMGRAEADDAWITIMSNANVIAVATLTDAACVIFAEGVEPDTELISLAESKGINLLKTALSSYETAIILHGALR